MLPVQTLRGLLNFTFRNSGEGLPRLRHFLQHKPLLLGLGQCHEPPALLRELSVLSCTPHVGTIVPAAAPFPFLFSAKVGTDGRLHIGRARSRDATAIAKEQQRRRCKVEQQRLSISSHAPRSRDTKGPRGG